MCRLRIVVWVSLAFTVLNLRPAAAQNGFLTLPLQDGSTPLYHGWFYNTQGDYHGAIDYKPLKSIPDPIPVVAAAGGLAIASCQPPLLPPPPRYTLGPVTLNSLAQVAQLDLRSSWDVKSLSGWPTDIGLKITGTWVGVIEFQVTKNGTTWEKLTLWSGKMAATSTSGSGSWGQNIVVETAASAVRFRMASYTSGVASISITATPSDTYGNFVLIDHQNGFSTLYAHLASSSLPAGAIVPCNARHLIQSGDIQYNGADGVQHTASWATVGRGNVLGEMGQTGTTYRHVHFELGGKKNTGSYDYHVLNRIDPYGIDSYAQAYPPPANKCGSGKGTYYWTACPPVVGSSNQVPTAGFTMTAPGLVPATNGQTLTASVPVGGFAQVTISALDCSPGPGTGCSYDPDGHIASRAWTIDGTATFVVGDTFPDAFNPGIHTLTLVVTDDKSAPSPLVQGTINVVQGVPLNLAPTAGFTMTAGPYVVPNGSVALNLVAPTNGSVTVTLSAPICPQGQTVGCSRDPDGQVTSRQWNIDGNAAGTAETFTWPFTPGPHTVALIVADNQGQPSAPAQGNVVVTQVTSVATIRQISDTLPGQTDAFTVAVERDGSRVAFTKTDLNSGSTSARLFIGSSTGVSPVEITPPNLHVIGQRISFAGGHVAFYACRIDLGECGIGGGEAFVMNFDGTGLTQISTGGRIVDPPGPVLSGDGLTVGFSQLRRFEPGQVFIGHFNGVDWSVAPVTIPGNGNIAGCDVGFAGGGVVPSTVEIQRRLG